MLQRRWIQMILLLFGLIAASGGYGLVHGDGPSAVLRTVPVGVVPGMVAVDAATNRVFVHNYRDMSVSVLDARTGSVLRTVMIGDPNAFLLVDVPAKRVLVGSDDTTLITLLDAASGAVAGTIQIPIFDGAVDPRTGHVFVTAKGFPGMGNAVSMIDGRRGALIRSSYLAGNMPLGVAVDPHTDHIFATNTGDDTTSMLDGSSGRLLRTVKVGSTPVGVAVDGQTGRVFVPNNGTNTVSMLDARSGAMLRTITVAPHPAKAVIDERTDRVFVVHGRGSTTVAAGSFPNYQQAGVTVLDARTGAVLRTLPVGGSTADDYVGWAPLTNIAVDVRRSRVFVINQAREGVVDDQGSVSVLDARSGSLLETISVGRHPVSLAVDDVTARLFVVNTNAGCLTGRDGWAWVPTSLRRQLSLLIPGPPKASCTRPGSVTVIDTAHA